MNSRGKDENAIEPQIAAGSIEAGPQAGGLPDPSRIRGSEGVLPASGQALGAEPLKGLPQTVKIPKTGEVLRAGPHAGIRDIARRYVSSTGFDYNPSKIYANVDPSRAQRIAHAYEQMQHSPSSPLVRASYDKMIEETMAQYQHAKKHGFKAEFWDPEKEKDPYEHSPRYAIKDIQDNNHLYVFPTRFGFGTDPVSAEELRDNPLLADSGERWNGQVVTMNDIFRAVHDYFGHAKEGVGFRADGEENAWRSHAAMYSPLARAAMTSETRGQNSWLNFGPHGEKNRTARTEDTHFADQKIGLMPAWTMYEGAEDFTPEETIKEIHKVREGHGKASGGSAIDRALHLASHLRKR